MIKVFIILIASLALTSPAFADIIFYESFESYNAGAKNIFDKDNPDRWRPAITGSDNYYQVAGSPARAGNRSMKFYNHRVSESNGYRCEIAAWSEDNLKLQLGHLTLFHF